MEHKNFQESLASVIAYANEHNSKIEKNTIKSMFQNILSTNDQFQSVYDYLTEKQIVIVDDEQSTVEESAAHQKDFFDTASLTEEEEKYLELYMDDLNHITILNQEEKIELQKNFFNNKDQYTQAVIEQYLFEVIKIAKNYTHPSLKIGDLIQEGNIGLICGIQSITEPTDLDAVLKKAIKNAIEAYISTELKSYQTNSHLLERINELEKVTRRLADQLEREATLEEIAEEMELTPEEVSTIMKHSIDALNTSIEEIDTDTTTEQ